MPHKFNCQGRSSNSSVNRAIQTDPPNEPCDNDQVPESANLINSSDQLVDKLFTQHSLMRPSTDKAVQCVLPQMIDKGVQSHSIPF